MNEIESQIIEWNDRPETKRVVLLIPSPTDDEALQVYTPLSDWVTSRISKILLSPITVWKNFCDGGISIPLTCHVIRGTGKALIWHSSLVKINKKVIHFEFKL